MLAILINLLFIVVEIAASVMAHSSSLLADAGHNFSDIVGLLLAFGANLLMQRKASSRFSYGYKRSSILAAFFNALILIATVVLIAFHSFQRMMAPEPVNELIVIVVAAIGIAVNAGSAMLFYKERSDINIAGAFLNLSFDALISIGVVISGVIVYYTHAYWVDPLAGLIIVLIMLWGIWDLFKKAFHMVLDAVPSSIDIEKVHQFFDSLPYVQEVHDLHVWNISTREVALTGHLVVPKGSLTNEEHTMINCQLFKLFEISHITLQVEQELLGDEKGHIHCGC